MSEVQKDSEDVFAGIGIFLKIKLLYKFSRNLRSKSARSTLTSPGPIRVNSPIHLSRFGTCIFAGDCTQRLDARFAGSQVCPLIPMISLPACLVRQLLELATAYSGTSRGLGGILPCLVGWFSSVAAEVHTAGPLTLASPMLYPLHHPAPRPPAQVPVIHNNQLALRHVSGHGPEVNRRAVSGC
jgi:hypothetical protein